MEVSKIYGEGEVDARTSGCKWLTGRKLDSNQDETIFQTGLNHLNGTPTKQEELTT